ncbi:hypothetical protein OF83DRAFT_313074 [Amylostereum chailletii]|nr:hypothetical protein OF83DRAFT_313074 [Amylostereum chailletii]
MSNQHNTGANPIHTTFVQLPPLAYPYPVYQGNQPLHPNYMECTLPDSPGGSAETLFNDNKSGSKHPLVKLGYDCANALTFKFKWKPGLAFYWIALCLAMVAFTIILEYLMTVNHQAKGWPVQASSENGFIHYLYTVPSSVLFMLLLALWSWMVSKVQGAQPVIELQQGSSQAKHSVFLNYNDMNTFLALPRACLNKHFIVAGMSFMSILGIFFQPLSGSLVSIRDTNLTLPDVMVSNRQLIGLNNDTQFQDLTTFLGASGFAAASVVYGLPEPPFIKDGYTVGNFDLPLGLAANGTLSANTTAIYSDPQCRDPDEYSMVQWPDGSGWNNTAVFSGCSFSWSVSNSSEQLFGVDTMPLSIPCPELDVTVSSEVAQVPVIFWFFTYQPSVMGSVTLCYPTIHLENVAITVDMSSANLSSVQYISDVFPGEASFTDYAGNITDAPLNYKAYNGLAWPEAQIIHDPFVNARADAIRLQLPAAVMEFAVQSPGGLTAAFENNLFASMSSVIYRRYLSMIAGMIYFLDGDEPLNVKVETTRKRVWLSDIAGHGLAGVMAVFGLGGIVLFRFHHRRLKGTKLPEVPSNFVFSAQYTVDTVFAAMAGNISDPKDLERAYQNYLFDLDSGGRIKMTPAPNASPQQPSWRKKIHKVSAGWFAQLSSRCMSSAEQFSA